MPGFDDAGVLPLSLRWLLATLACAAVLVFAERGYLFGPPVFETSDLAANALAVENAKHFEQLDGHYSRWGFHHPGPAFFYLFAAGEVVFDDGLGLVASPHQAHVLAVVLLQAGLFAATLLVARGLAGGPGFVGLALPALALHFGLVRNAFFSAWIPYALIVPFLCLLVCCAALVAGRAGPLPLAVLAGSLLVHGYVAMPLFVVPLFTVAYGGLLLAGRRAEGRWTGAWRRYRGAHLAALAVLALMCAPLLLDLGRGADSNVLHIVRHWLDTPRSDTRWKDAAVLGLSFFTYEPDTNLAVNASGFHAGAYFREHLAASVVWGGALLALLAGRIRRRHRPAAGSLVLAALVVALAVLWGRQQNGPMYRFQSLFLAAVPGAVVLALAAAWPVRGAVGRWLDAGGIALGAGLVLALPSPLTYAALPEAVQNRDAALALAAERPGRLVALTFPDSAWPAATSVALALRRAGIAFAVEPAWRWMFGCEGSPSATDAAGGDLWRIAPRPAAGGGMPLVSGFAVGRAFAPLSPRAGVISFGAEGNFQAYVAGGVEDPSPDPRRSWTIGDCVSFAFAPEPAPADVELVVVVDAVVSPRGGTTQPCRVTWNGEPIGEAELAAGCEARIAVPRGRWNAASPALLRLWLPRAVSPARLRRGVDMRRLAALLAALRFHLR